MENITLATLALMLLSALATMALALLYSLALVSADTEVVEWQILDTRLCMAREHAVHATIAAERAHSALSCVTARLHVLTYQDDRGPAFLACVREALTVERVTGLPARVQLARRGLVPFEFPGAYRARELDRSRLAPRDPRVLPNGWGPGRREHGPYAYLA